MDIWQTALATAALIVGMLVFDNRRALAWLLVGVIDFIVCAVYQQVDPQIVPYPMFTGLVDASVCLGIYLLGRYRWEVWLFRVFQLSVLFSVLRLFEIIDTTYTYVAMLELANWLALFVIGGTHLLRHVNGLGLLGDPARWRLRNLDRALNAKRAHPPFGGAA